jgi:multidrug resistance protein MdtO
MARTRFRNTNVLRLIMAELAPFRGRFAGSTRDTIGIVIALAICMTLRVPGIALALSLLFLLQRDRPGLTLRSAAQMLGGAATACVASLFWVQITDGTEVARYLGFVVGIFFAAFGMANTSLPLFFTMFGFYGFLDLAAWDTHRRPNVIVTNNLYEIAALAIVVLSAVAVEYVFGIQRPEEELDREMRKHLSLLSRFFHLLAQEPSVHDQEALRSLHRAVVQSAYIGDRRMNELYERVRNISPTLAKVPLGLHYRIGLLTRILERSSLVGFNIIAKRDREDRAYCAAIAAQCDRAMGLDETGECEAQFAQLPASSSTWLIDILNELRHYSDSHTLPTASANNPTTQLAEIRPTFRLFLPGAFHSADNATYSLKLTLAATVCYTVYNAIAWPGIHTCVITVLFTGLSPTGQMKQRQTYRFFGTAVGGFLAIAAESLFFPNMDSVTSLVCLVAAVAFVSGWVLRSPHMGSVGTQIGFAFFLTTLQEFAATTQISTARDRVIGVALGTLVMWFIFDQMWPVRTSQALSQILRRIQNAATQLHQAHLRHKPQMYAHSLSRLRIAVSLDLATMQQLESGAYFDFGRGHVRELAQSRRLIRKIEAAASEFYTEALRRRNDILTKTFSGS